MSATTTAREWEKQLESQIVGSPYVQPVTYLNGPGGVILPFYGFDSAITIDIESIVI